MNCSQYRECHPSAASEARAHEASCAECRAFARSWDLLGAVSPLEPRADFFAGVRRKLSPRILRFAAPLAAVAAAVLIGILIFAHPPRKAPPRVSDEERELVENLDLLENYELARTLEMVGETRSPLLEEK